MFLQDFNSSTVPVSASAYIYVGSYLNDKLTEISSSGGGGTDITIKDEGSNITTAASSIDFVGAAVVASNDGNDVTVTLSSAVFSRTFVTASVTSSATDRIIGVSASAAMDIRLPGASAFSAGGNFTIKDEAGNANNFNITVRASGSETIDGQSSVILESPHAALNLYSNGTNKFFIY